MFLRVTGAQSGSATNMQSHFTDSLAGRTLCHLAGCIFSPKVQVRTWYRKSRLYNQPIQAKWLIPEFPRSLCFLRHHSGLSNGTAWAPGHVLYFWGDRVGRRWKDDELFHCTLNRRSTFTCSRFPVALVAQNHWLLVLSVAILLEETCSALQGGPEPTSPLLLAAQACPYLMPNSSSCQSFTSFQQGCKN